MNTKPKNDVKAMRAIVDQWTRPGAKITEAEAPTMINQLHEMQEVVKNIYFDKSLPLESKLEACNLLIKIIDFKLSIATGQRQLNIVPDYETKTKK